MEKEGLDLKISDTVYYFKKTIGDCFIKRKGIVAEIETGVMDSALVTILSEDNTFIKRYYDTKAYAEGAYFKEVYCWWEENEWSVELI